MDDKTLVRCGAVASSDELQYNISTDVAKKYLQDKFNALTEAMRKKGIAQNDINIIMYTFNAGKRFLPFALVLPMDVLDKSSNKDDENKPSIFRRDDDNDAVRLNPAFYEMLRVYSYNKYDKEAFKSPEWKRRSGVARDTANFTIRFATPKIETFDGQKKVVLIIDPIRLFHDMLKLNDPSKNTQFEVIISKWDKISEGNYDFKIVRKKTKNNKNNESFYNQLSRMIRKSF